MGAQEGTLMLTSPTLIPHMGTKENGNCHHRILESGFEP